MDITWIGSPYFGYPDGTQGRNGYKPIAVCMHIAEGTLAGCDSWFNSPNNQGSSTHYCIGKSGEIHQYVEETDAAWGNGQVKKPTWPLLIRGRQPQPLYDQHRARRAHRRALDGSDVPGRPLADPADCRPLEDPV